MQDKQFASSRTSSRSALATTAARTCFCTLATRPLPTDFRMFLERHAELLASAAGVDGARS